ncbi:MAG: hypothetical protein ACE5JQ_17920, partial [Candidatus Methylomirabilales bacterium]
MAEQTFPGGLWIPHPPIMQSAAPNLQNMLIDASTEKAAGVFRAPKTGTISKVGFLTGTVTTGATVDVRLETVDLANGDPSGTLLGTNSNGSQVIADTDDNTWFTTTLTTGVAVTKGDLLAVVIANAGSGNMNIRNVRYDFTGGYSDLFTAAWVKDNDSPGFGLEYSDGSYAYSPHVWPVSGLTSNLNFNSSSTPDERGLIFQLPFPFRVTGCWLTVDLDNAADVVLYDSDGSTALETLSLDPDVRMDTAQRIFLLTFAGTQSLSANTNYRLVLKPTTTSNIRVSFFSVDAAAVMDALEGGQNFQYTERTDAGAWTETATDRPFVGLICDGFDDGVGGGGGLL